MFQSLVSLAEEHLDRDGDAMRLPVDDQKPPGQGTESTERGTETL
ncbi:hypothetical protein [Streptomyces sp. NPDC059215]